MANLLKVRPNDPLTISPGTFNTVVGLARFLLGRTGAEKP